MSWQPRGNKGVPAAVVSLLLLPRNESRIDSYSTRIHRFICSRSFFEPLQPTLELLARLVRGAPVAGSEVAADRLAHRRLTPLGVKRLVSRVLARELLQFLEADGRPERRPAGAAWSPTRTAAAARRLHAH